jgi:hypothetical protein
MFTLSPSAGLSLPITALLLIAALTLLAATIAQRQPLPLVVYSSIITAIALGDTGHWSSRGRFLLPAFPLLIPIARRLSRAHKRLTSITLTAGLGTLTACYGAYVMLYSIRAP